MSVTFFYTARYTNPQTPEAALTQKAWSRGWHKIHEMGAQHLHLKGTAQPGPGPSVLALSKDSASSYSVWVRDTPGNQIK